MKKIFTFLAAVLFVCTSAVAESYTVKGPNNGVVTAGAVLENNGDAMIVSAIYATSAKNKDMLKTESDVFPDGTRANLFCAASTKMRLTSAPTIEVPDGVVNDGCTAFKMVILSEIKSMSLYAEAAAGKRSFHLFNRITGDTYSQSFSTEKGVDPAVAGTNVGYVATWTDIAPGEYTLYNTGFGGGFCGIVYEIAESGVAAPISWNPAEKTISIENAKTFSPVLEGAEGLAGIAYTSDNELVATVDEAGKVAFTGKSGKVTITAAYPGDETYKPTTVKCVIIVELGKEIKVGEVVLPIGAIGDEVANGTGVKYIVAANTEIFADDNITITNKAATLRAADSKNICGAGLSNYIQIRNQNDENTELVITPKANMELVVYGRLQDRATDMPEVQNTKNITLTEDGASALPGTLYFSEWLTGTEAKPYEYFLMGQSFNLEAGKTYTLSASGFGFRLYGFSYTAEALPSIEAPGHDQYGDIVQADGEQVVTFTPAVEGHVIYTCFVPAVVDNAMALAADATIEHDGKTFSLAADNKVTVSTSGTLHYFAMEPASGIKSEVKTIEFAISTAITDINVDNANAPVEYFNLQGIRVENPANGLYIRRQGNKVEKVYVK